MYNIRNAIDWTLVSLNLLEKQVTQKRFHPDFFSIDSLPGGDTKHSGKWRDPALLNMIVVHVTAVKGGFGVSSIQRKQWDARISDGILWLPPGMFDIGRQLAVAGVVGEELGVTGEHGLDNGFPIIDDPLRIAKRLALWQRFRGTPYHQLATRSGDVLANRSLSQYSYHGNGGNIGAGLAFDMHPDETPGEDFVETGRHALRMLALRMGLYRKPESPIIVVTSHRQHKYPGRANDPGAWVSREIVVPVVKERDDLVINHGLVTGSGRPWPNTWDPSSPYDTKGRRIDGR